MAKMTADEYFQWRETPNPKDPSKFRENVYKSQLWLAKDVTPLLAVQVRKGIEAFISIWPETIVGNLLKMVRGQDAVYALC